MPMFRRPLVALRAAIAAGALILSSAAGAQATAHSAKVTMPARGASGVRPATGVFPQGYISLRPDYPGSGCLNSHGYNMQTRLEACPIPASTWFVTYLSGIDTRGGVWVQLSDVNDGYCLDAQDNATGSPNINGDHVNSWPCDGAAQQRWYFWPIANNDWMIVSGFNTNKVLDARTNNIWNPATPGDPVQVWDHVSTPQQAWIVICDTDC
jgi:Ricin-type beta-trefoil lectin domain-like